ncbi:MAG: helix-turn-helix domain-containing protein [Sphingobium sp.]|nr:helix-turn-helix domain-containing protein [Sphingobium sp.]MBP6113076.1 helix-turn-helix domain-containing protein [Sphingobium sp.]MBP8672205.1 helix-turn-helix domain-containing protein [Sphingobium sp.]MBP9156339.1 helix-turn-helix domain-containing protein [Sphingobium sp.]
MAKEKAPPYAALPISALADRNLSRNLLAVLGAIAYHDRFSLCSEPRGQGCWATNETLARHAGVEITVVSRSISKLAELGYVAIKRGKAGPRARKTLFVIYPELNGTGANERNSLNGTGAIQNANAIGTGANLLIGKPDSQRTDFNGEKCPKENLYEENLLRYAAEAARSQNAIAAAYAKIDSPDDYENVTAFLSIVERELGQTPSLTTPQLIEALDQLNSDTRDIRIANHALRLIEKFSPEDGEDGLGNGSQDEPPAPLSEQDARFLAHIRSTWAEVGDDPEKRKLLATKSGLSLSTIAAVTQGHAHLSSQDIKRLRDVCVSI